MTRLASRFQDRFGVRPRIARAPGRVNIIGEHTDYTEGFVMPVAIDRSTWVAAAPRQDDHLVAHSETVGKTIDVPLGDGSRRPERDWSDYIFGVAVGLRRAGVPLHGASLLITSDVPLGAGVSSSAALEVAVAYALVHIAGVTLDPIRIARLCQEAENEYVGARCGIMDQFIATHARPGHAIALDCRSLEHTAVPLPSDVRLVIANTMVKHSIAAGEYNKRRAECERATRQLAARLPHVRTLRDVTLDDLDRESDALTDMERRRARHIVSENVRVQEATRALQRGDLAVVGSLMAHSHASLRDDFAVSCRELDILVALAAAQPGVYAARMTGGGFGGCTVNLVAAAAVDPVVDAVHEGYRRCTGITPEIYVCAAAGAAEMADAA